MVAPLSGITVLEVANWIAVPSAGAIMADLGATVLKVEPRRGDAMRDLMRKPSRGKPPAEEHDYTFHVENRGKRSIAVDLDRDELGVAQPRRGAPQGIFWDFAGIP